MSKGLGRIQRECLRVIKACEAAGKRPTTFTVTVEVYRVEPTENGDRLCNDAQHTATKRALANLRRKGLIAGQPDITVYPNGKRIFTYVRVGGRHAERCCRWSTGAAEPGADDLAVNNDNA